MARSAAITPIEPRRPTRGRRFDERLQDLGARRIGEVCRLDATSGLQPETEAVAWCRAWLAEALK